MELQWPLILFTTFIAWSAGLFGTQGLYLLRGEGKKAHMTALIASFVLMVVGGISVFFHLQHWERIFNGFGHITSGITQELIAIVLMFIVMVVVFVYLRRSGDEVAVPKWASILAIVTAVLLVCVMGHSYMMPSLPAWNSVLQVASLLGAACALGPATMALICSLSDEAAEYHGKPMVIGQAINVVFAIGYTVAMGLASSSLTHVSYWFDPVSPTLDVTQKETFSLFSGDSTIMLVLAIVLPLIGLAVAFLGKKQTAKWKAYAAVAILAVVVGAICLRVLFYQMGVSVYPFF